MEKLTYEELVAVERMLASICKKYENIAQMTKIPTSNIDKVDYEKATNTLTYFNKKRDLIIEEMERRVNKLFE